MPFGMGNHFDRRSFLPHLGVFVALLTTFACADPQSVISTEDATEITESAPPKDVIEVSPSDTVLVEPSHADSLGPDADDVITTDVASDPSDLPPRDDEDGAETRPGPAEVGITSRACDITVSYVAQPGEAPTQVLFASSLTAWGADAIALTQGPDGVFEASLDAAAYTPGSYGYKFIVDGQWTLDPDNMMKRFDDGTVNSKLIIPDCTTPALQLIERVVDTEQMTLNAQIRLLAGSDGALGVCTAASPPTLSPPIPPPPPLPPPAPPPPPPPAAPPAAAAASHA